MSKIHHHVLLTGPPGVGKTTLTQKICKELLKHGVTLSGFYTEEVRAQGRRTGFDVVTIPAGERRILARTEDLSTGNRGPKVGQYIVNVPSFESVALPALANPQGDVLVVDEVGRMELFSTSFEPTLQRALTRRIAMLATVPLARGKPMPAVEKLRSRADARLFTIDRNNRDDPGLIQEILSILTSK